MKNLSALGRLEGLRAASQQTFDLIVIGGGITGAGIALDAANRGLSVALFEKHDFAWGTSSRSTKLIHGGLRYLKQFEVNLVREVGLERAIVHRNARHIVRPERMLLPIVTGGSLGYTMSSIGLWVYDKLADVPKTERRVMLSAKRSSEVEPLLRQDILTGGGLYYEYRTDDARLTIEALKTASAAGALCFNYSSVQAFTYQDAQINGVEVRDEVGGETFQIKAKLVVNAAGPWVDNLRKLDHEDPAAQQPKKRLHLTKGIHVVVPYAKLPLQQSVYFDVLADKRMVFAIPRAGVTYIGTTDTNYQGDTDNPVATTADVQYVLDAANAMFPSIHLKLDDVVSTWAGLRPLIHETGKSPSELSRKDEVFLSATGLISIAGGKLTGYRKMAEKVVDQVCHKLKHKASCNTETLTLSGGDFANDEAVNTFTHQRIGEVRQLNIPAAEIASLVWKYGSNTDAIIEHAFELFPSVQDGPKALLMAEVWYGVEHEMCLSLSDFIIRRTGRLYFERETLAQLYPAIATYQGQLLGWDEAKRQAEISQFEQAYQEVLAFKTGI